MLLSVDAGPCTICENQRGGTGQEDDRHPDMRSNLLLYILQTTIDSDPFKHTPRLPCCQHGLQGVTQMDLKMDYNENLHQT